MVKVEPLGASAVKAMFPVKVTVSSIGFCWLRVQAGYKRILRAHRKLGRESGADRGWCLARSSKPLWRVKRRVGSIPTRSRQPEATDQPPALAKFEPYLPTDST